MRKQASKVSLARQLAAQSVALRDVRLDRALLLALEAHERLEKQPAASRAEGLSALLTAVSHNTPLTRYLHGHRE